jgi:iron complex outermembrane recepter protein
MSLIVGTTHRDRDFVANGGNVVRWMIVFSAILALGTARVAKAQQGDSQSPSGLAALEEVVVTAERRPEPLDQLPIAASVIAGGGLQEQGVNSVQDLSSVAPSINIQNQQALSYVNIRGVGLQATNPTTSSGVAVYSDGFFIPHETAISDDYYDVQQVEILRGPQGTLVGQNSTGGALFVNSVRPSFDAHTGFIDQSFGNFGYSKTEGAFNAPISDTLAVRVAGNFYSRDSFYDDLHLGSPPQTLNLHPGNADSWSGRIGVQWQPVSSFSIYLKYETARRDGDGYIGKDYGELAGANNVLDARLSQPFIISYDEPSYDKYRLSRVSAEVNWDISDRVRLRSFTGYQDADINNQFDNDQTNYPLSWADQRLDESSFQQELNLISQGSGAFNWILGAFYLHDSTPTYLHLYTAPPGPPPTFTINTDPYEDSYALFGQATYAFSDMWQLLAGVRETWDHKTQTGTQTLEIPTGLPPPFPSTALIPLPLNGSVDATETTGKVALSFLPTTDSTLYASASRGFKPGGLNAGNLVSLTFAPEKITAYEAGYKGSFMDRRLTTRVAAFYYDYDDMQTTAIDAAGERAIINVPKSKIYGAEFELEARLADLTLSLAGSYDDSSVDGQLVLVDSGNPFAGPQNLQGRSLPYAPRWTGNFGATYVVPSPIGKFALTAQYSYADRAYASLFELVPRDFLDSHSLFNAAINLTFKDGIWLELYGTNLTDKLYAAGTIGNDSAVWGAPRQYGGRVGYRF